MLIISTFIYKNAYYLNFRNISFDFLWSMVLFIAVFRDVAVFGDTNLELPSFLSNRSAVEIHLDVDSNIFYQSADINLELPLHARYQVSKTRYGFKPAHVVTIFLN